MMEKSELIVNSTGKSDGNAIITNLSRDVRTPLNVIISMSELLAASDNLNDKDWDYANMIYSASKTLLKIMDDVVDFSHYSQGEYIIEKNAYFINALVKETEDIIKEKIDEKNLRFSVSIDPRIPEKIIGDENKVKQIILNLLNNAVKYTDVGFVELKIGYKPIDNSAFQLLFIVTDSGIGIKKENLDSVFDEFIKDDSLNSDSKEGTGLELAITKKLCELMDGSITVTSEYGKGSTFAAFIVQSIDPDCIKEEKIISLSDDFEIGKFIAPNFRILAVDDNKVGLRVIVELLKQFGIRTDTASSGQEAIKMASSDKYNLIFMDYLMPQMDGKETTIKIREMNSSICKEIPIVALTAEAIRTSKEEFLECGMNDYLTKPVRMEDLKNILCKYVPLDMREYVG